MRTRKSQNNYWIAMGVLLLSACATPAPAPVPMQNVDNTNPRAKLIIGSSELLGYVELRNPIFRDVGQLTQSQVELVSLINSTLSLEYRIDWQDSNGFKAGTVNSWQFVSLPSNGSEILTSTGKVPEAMGITVTVRLPDDLFDSTYDEAEPEQ